MQRNLVEVSKIKINNIQRRKPTKMKSYEEEADKFNWPENIRVMHRHTVKLFKFIYRLRKKTWAKDLVSNFRANDKLNRAMLKIEKDGKVVITDISMLHILATECFNRGIDFAIDQLQCVNKAEDILVSLKDENRNKLKKIFIDRVEIPQNELRNRPVAPVKYSKDDYKCVDEVIISKGYKQYAAILEVANSRDITNINSFYRSYRSYLNKKRKSAK